MSATVLHRGLISGYTARRAAFVGRRDWHNAAYWRILRQILLFSGCRVPEYTAGTAGSSLNSW